MGVRLTTYPDLDARSVALPHVVDVGTQGIGGALLFVG